MWYSAVGFIVTLLVSLLAGPLAAAAQPLGKVYRIGFLSTDPHPPPFKCRLFSYATLGSGG